MDEIDLKITMLLAEDGRLGNSEIARQLGISEGTVRQRLKKLIDADVVKVQAIINSDRVPNRVLAIIGLKIEGLLRFPGL